jgi:hypothetical protein
MDKFIRWSKDDDSCGGVFKLSLDGSTFSYEIISGSAIPASELVALLWFFPDLEEFREAARKCKRKGDWKVSSRTGMSGSTNWWIEFDKNGIIRSTSTIWHDSMYNKANENLTCWIRDLYDLFWDFKRKGIYASSFDPEIHTYYGYVNVTKEIEERREAFRKEANACFEGFGTPEVVEEDDEIIDYSNYRPTEE